MSIAIILIQELFSWPNTEIWNELEHRVRAHRLRLCLVPRSQQHLEFIDLSSAVLQFHPPLSPRLQNSRPDTPLEVHRRLLVPVSLSVLQESRQEENRKGEHPMWHRGPAKILLQYFSFHNCFLRILLRKSNLTVIWWLDEHVKSVASRWKQWGREPTGALSMTFPSRCSSSSLFWVLPPVTPIASSPTQMWPPSYHSVSRSHWWDQSLPRWPAQSGIFTAHHLASQEHMDIHTPLSTQTEHHTVLLCLRSLQLFLISFSSSPLAKSVLLQVSSFSLRCFRSSTPSSTFHSHLVISPALVASSTRSKLQLTSLALTCSLKRHSHTINCPASFLPWVSHR